MKTNSLPMKHVGLNDDPFLLRCFNKTTTPPETDIFAPENGWLEYDPFLLGFGLFSGENC